MTKPKQQVDDPGEVVMSNGEINDILVYVQRHPDKEIKEVAAVFGRHQSTIRRMLAKYKSTTVLARQTILSRASELVDRVLEKADVDQLIDVLQRSNIGVLEPIKTGGGGGNTNVGVLVSVNPSNLAAVDASTYDSGRHLGPATTTDGEIIKPKRIQVGPTPIGEFAGS